MATDEWTQAKFEALTMHSADIISLLDSEGRLLFNSPATLRINGFTPQELAGKDTFELIHPDDRAEVARLLREVIATPGALRRAEYRYLTKDGRWLWMEAIATNQLDNPAVRGVVANSRDISERKRAEEDRLRLEQQLLAARKFESLGVMAAGIAHDFNNLLALILGEASVLKQTLGPGAAESLGTIENAATRANELTQQLLAYTGRRLSLLEPTDLRRLIEELQPLLVASAHGSVSLEFELAAGMHPVVCDSGQVRQVLLNLVRNGAEAIAGAGTITVRLAHRTVVEAELTGPLAAGFPPGDAVVVEVQDTGAGVPAHTMDRIFDPFFTTKEPGRGLGLSAVSGVVRGHQAALSVESKAGEGTLFRLFFRPSPLAEKKVPERSVGRFAGKVLIIDDDELVAHTTGRLLSTLGLDCAMCHDGNEAVERFSEAPASFDLVVSDVLMPGLDGPATVAKLRAIRSDVPVLFMSGFTPDPKVLAGDAVTVFLAKPFNANALRAVLSRLLPVAEQPGR